jgi:ankyrin repeat protein
MCCQFPVLGKLVLNNLDEQSLSNCKEASRVVSQFLINERFFWIRMIQKHYKNLSTYVYHKADIHQLENKNPGNKDGKTALHITPLHLASEKGHLETCQFIMDTLENNNQGNIMGQTPLHEAIWQHISLS